MPRSHPSGRITAASLRATLRAHADPAHAAGAQRYFVDGVKTYGVHRETLHRLSREAAAALKAAPGGKTGVGLTRALEIGDRLFRSGNLDEASVATRIVERFSRGVTPAHLARFDRWVDSLRDWASCDALCGELIGPLVRDHPQLISRIAPWTRSGHRWRRRAAAVSLIPLARTGEHLPAIFRVADRLLGDDDLMVQKGVGWLLKEATRRRAPEVVAYLIGNRSRTSRLVLRYASEKLPAVQRRRVLGS
ncbi:MAG: DNA alkylation repair protein [bacterium]